MLRKVSKDKILCFTDTFIIIIIIVYKIPAHSVAMEVKTIKHHSDVIVTAALQLSASQCLC